VLKALFLASDDGTYRVELKMTDEGARKLRDYTSEHREQCIALVAGGKILWHPSLGEPVTDDTFVLSGQFSISEAQAITQLFNN